MAKRTNWNKESNKILKDKFDKLGVRWCEICGSQSFLTFAHKVKRRHMNSVEELSDIQNVLLLCVNCHQRQEFSKEITEEWFNRLRGN